MFHDRLRDGSHGRRVAVSLSGEFKAVSNVQEDHQDTDGPRYNQEEAGPGSFDVQDPRRVCRRRSTHLHELRNVQRGRLAGRQGRARVEKPF